MKATLIAATIAVAVLAGCATESPNGSSDRRVTPAEGRNVATYQDNDGNQSALGSYTTADARRSWNAMTSTEKQNGCRIYWSGNMMASLTSAGYPYSDARTTENFLATVC